MDPLGAAGVQSPPAPSAYTPDSVCSNLQVRFALVALVCGCVWSLPASGLADAIVRSQAMLATTIVEYYVKDESVTVELEIGLRDLETFRNLLPDDIYERAGHSPRPMSERLELFFREDLVIRPEAGEPLPGRLLGIEARPRVRRDEITGEPLTAKEDDEELVVFAQLEYVLPEAPASLTFLGPRGETAASIGFVVYHHRIPVNDFRYLTPSQTLELDWEDPWYSRFRNRNLRRSYDAPMSGFIYIEPYEVRKEIIARPRDLQKWVDLGLADRTTIPVELQAELKRKAAEFLRLHQPVLIDDQTVEPELARINFLERTLRTSRVIEPPVELDVDSAVLGVIFVYPTDGLPQHVTMDWDLWTERLERIPAAAVDQAGPFQTYLEPDYRVLEWQNFLKHPELPTLRVLASPPGPLARSMLIGRWLFLGLALLAAWNWLRSRRRWHAVVAAALVIVGVASFLVGRDAALSDNRARQVVADLLHNVYRAFDFRDEEQIYDTLERSVDGNLLAQIYLETRRGLELANQGGARAKVKEIELLDLHAESAGRGGFVATATWNVAGSVGHWGHMHQRRNQYRAELVVSPIDGVWKLVDLEILLEERL